MDVRKFSIEEAVSFSWKTVIKNIAFIVILFVIFLLVSMVSQALTRIAMGNFLSVAIVTVISWVANALITMGVIKVALKFCDNQKPGFEDLYSSYPLILNYIGALILFWIACAIGLVLLIVPGIILMLRLQFFAYFIVDKNMSPIKALEASWKATEGNTLNLLVLWFAFLLITILGALALLVGLLVAIPVMMIAMAYIYRKLADGTTPSQAAPVIIQQAKPVSTEKPAVEAGTNKAPGTFTVKLDTKTALIGAGVLIALIAGMVVVKGCQQASNKAMQKQIASNKAMAELQAQIDELEKPSYVAPVEPPPPPVFTMADAQRFDALQREWAGNLDGAGKAISKYDFSTCDTYIDRCLEIVDSMKQIVAGKVVDERLVTARLNAIETMTIAYANTNEILAINKNPTTKDQDWPKLMSLSLETMDYFDKAAKMFDYSDASDMGDVCRNMRASIETLVVEIKQKSGKK